jgi:hypothetical protein
VMVEKGRGVMEWNGKAGSCGLMISKIRGLKERGRESGL